jgi:transposase InsO family protein
MQARQALEEWRCDYNLVRPHSSIGWLAPANSHRHRAKPLRSAMAPRARLSPPLPCAMDDFATDI